MSYTSSLAAGLPLPFVCVTTAKPLGFMVILGMDGITALEGVAIVAQNSVRFGIEKPEICAAADTVEEPDFSAIYDPFF